MIQDGGNSTAYRFGEFRLDRSLLAFRSIAVPLTPKAVDTLYLLVSRAPEVVSKEEIMKAVWPDTFVVESSLARNISLIRKALEDRSGPHPYIETIPKRGYRFVSPVNPEGRQPEPFRLAWLMPAAGIVLIAAAALALYWRPSGPPPEPDPATLIGWHLFHKVTPAEIRQALTVFENTVALQPGSATAHAGLAAALITLPRLSGGHADLLARAKRESETAVRLDPRLGAAHAALGMARMVADWDFTGAEASFRRALDLDPHSILALVGLSQLLSATVRSNEALALAQQAAKIDPVSPMIGVQVGIAFYHQRRFDDAARQFRSVLERERGFALAHYYLGLTYGYLERFQDALEHLAKADLHPGMLRADRAWLALRQGDRKPAETLYSQLQADVRAGSASASSLLLLAASLGLLEDAFSSLEVAQRERNPDLLNLRSDPRLEPLRADQRYEEAVRRLSEIGFHR